MKYYEFKSVILGSGGRITPSDIQDLNKLYGDGWDFVNSVPQMVSAGRNILYGPIIFTLRKKIIVGPIDPFETK